MSDPKRIKLDNIEESKKIFETLYESDFVGTKQTIKCRDDEVNLGLLNVRFRSKIFRNFSEI